MTPSKGVWYPWGYTHPVAVKPVSVREGIVAGTALYATGFFS